MKREQIPVSYKHVALIGTLVTGPILFGAGIVFFSSGAASMSGSSLRIFILLLICSAVLSISVCGAMLQRRSVELCNDILTVRTSFYTVRLCADKIHMLEISTIANISQVRITSKRNGVAAFGFLSGWFNANHVNIVFCAVSTNPICYLTFRGHAKCGALAISRTESIDNLLAEWSKGRAKPDTLSEVCNDL